MEFGKEKEAQAEVQAWMGKDPTVTIEALTGQAKRHPFKDHSFIDRQFQLLRRVGIPDCFDQRSSLPFGRVIFQ